MLNVILGLLKQLANAIQLGDNPVAFKAVSALWSRVGGRFVTNDIKVIGEQISALEREVLRIKGISNKLNQLRAVHPFPASLTPVPANVPKFLFYPPTVGAVSDAALASWHLDLRLIRLGAEMRVLAQEQLAAKELPAILAKGNALSLLLTLILVGVSPPVWIGLLFAVVGVMVDKSIEDPRYGDMWANLAEAGIGPG